VLDASRAVSTVSSLLSVEQKAGYVAQNREDQQRLRDIFALRNEKPPLPFADAQAQRPRLTYLPSPVPQRVGRQLELAIDLREVVPYIDWTFFFLTWDMSGKFPQILSHPERGPHATELYNNAQKMLAELLDGGRLTGSAVWGLWPAWSDGNDVVLADPKDGQTELEKFVFLRQQRHKTDSEASQWSLADFVAPKSAGVLDYVGAFAVTSGHGLEAICAEYEAKHDDYSAIMAKALADRLAEAMAEWLHERVRRLWYSPEEKLGNEQLIAESYRGIRPAFGYPATPDHSEKTKLWHLLGADEAGIHLTETLAMTPGASVSGLYLGHPESRYFALGRVGDDQLTDYAARKGTDLETVKHWLGSTIAQ
jgi:5-methyltetrahydrofolate--homocysteine methyltransferase